MTVAFSTSSPLVSVALFDAASRLLAARQRMAGRGGSQALLELLDQCLADTNESLESAIGFACDLGPGSFVGVRVGVTMAKTLAWTYSVPSAGVPAWRLIGGPDERIAIPNKRNEFFLFEGGVFELVENPKESVGYGPAFEENPTFPLAEHMPVNQLEWKPALELLPFYAIGPSISQPKTPYRAVTS